MGVHRHPVAVSNVQGPLAGVPLDRALIGRLCARFSLVRGMGLRLAEVFYARLFSAAPHLTALFRTEPAAQSAKLIASLDAIVRNLEAPEDNAAMIAALGQRHAGYGAKPEHYGLVVDLLVESIREVLGSQIDARGLDEWKTALTLVSRQMIAASEGAGGA